MKTRLLKKHILLSLGFLFLAGILFGGTVSAQTLKSSSKPWADSLYGPNKVCPFISYKDKNGKWSQGDLYMPFSNISTDFVVFQNILDVTKQGDNVCLKVVGSMDKVLVMIFRIFIGGASVLAVIYIAIAGISLITEQANLTKRMQAKDMLRHALIGLLLSVSAWVLLYTINPQLVAGNSFDEALNSSGIPQANEQSKGVVGANVDILGTINPYGVVGGAIGAAAGIAGAQNAALLDGAAQMSGTMDSRTGSGVFASQNRLYSVSGIPDYVEKGYTPQTINGVTYFVGKTTTFGGGGDINANSYKNLAIDTSMREIDLQPNNDDYISARWMYDRISPSALRSDYDVEVMNLQTGKAYVLQPLNGKPIKDWGPHPNAPSNADFDVSNRVLERIGAQDGSQIGVRLIPRN